MNVKGVNGSGTGLQSFGMNRNQGNDSVSKNLQNRIADAQKQMQELGDNKEMSLEEKMKKRQEIQQQISDLQNQLRQHQIEKSKENRQKKGSSMDDMLGGNRQAQRQAGGSKGMSNASMKALISADTSMDQVKIQGAAKGQAEGKAGVLKAEIKLDSGRGGDTRKKEEELAKTEEKVNEITQSQMNVLSDINKKVDEAAKADREAKKIEEKEADKAKEADENKAGLEKTGNEEVEQRENAKNADIASLKNLFTGHNSFADKIMSKGNSIARAAAGAGGTYTSSGNYASALSSLVSTKIDTKE